MEKPNIFSIATKELSQDAFLAWMIQWADESYKDVNDSLHDIGVNFVKFLIRKVCDTTNLNISSVEVGRQWKNIDVWADINKKYFLIIEDKVDTDEHDNQLIRYTEICKEYYGESRILIPVYVKTGIESIFNADLIEQKGWKYCGREELLSFFNLYSCSNDIYTDFVSCLNIKNDKSKSFNVFKNLYSWDAIEGLFVWLQKHLGEDSGWGYVPNPSGGFLGLWFHGQKAKTNRELEFYLQIENNYYDKSNLFIKMSGKWERTTSYLYDRLYYLQNKASEFGLTISKPPRYRTGEYTSLAIVDNVFCEKNGELDLNLLINKIKQAMQLVDNVAANS